MFRKEKGRLFFDEIGIPLTEMEDRIIDYLRSNRHRWIQSAELSESCGVKSSSNIKVHICRLRKKIDVLTDVNEILLSSKKGYIFIADW